MIVTEMKLLCDGVEKSGNLAVVKFSPTSVPLPPNPKREETGVAIAECGLFVAKVVLVEPWPSKYVLGQTYPLIIPDNVTKPPPGPPG